MVVELLRGQLDVPVVMRSIPRTELYAAEEAFLCGTLDEVRSIGSIDGLPLRSAPGPVTSAVRSRYLDVCTGRVATSDTELLVPVGTSARTAG